MIITLMLVTCVDNACYRNYRFDLPVKNIVSMRTMPVNLCKTIPYQFPVRTLVDCNTEMVCYVVSKDEEGTDKRLVSSSCASIRKLLKKEDKE